MARAMAGVEPPGVDGGVNEGLRSDGSEGAVAVVDAIAASSWSGFVAGGALPSRAPDGRSSTSPRSWGVLRGE